MKTIILIMALLVSGCGVDNNNHGYGYHYDFITSLGIEYRHEAGYSELDKHRIDSIFRQVSECMSVFVIPDDLMIIMDDDLSRFTQIPAYDDVFLSSPNLIVLKQNDYVTVINALRHAYVHYLLYKTTGSADVRHSSNYFVC